MGVSAAETAKKHDEILDESIRLFRRDGLDVSVGEVMKAVGLTHGPFYNHFASKEALVVEALLRSMEKSQQQMQGFPGTARGRDAYLDSYMSVAHVADPGSGCSIAALAAEVAREAGVVTSFTQKLKEGLTALTGHFPWSKTKRQARGAAIHAYCSMVGAVILARAVDDPVLARELLTETRARIG